VKRGDVFIAATGSGFGGKPRPVVIIQGDAYANAPVVMVAPLTDEKHDIELIRPLVIADPSNGLRKSSVIATDTLIAVRRHQFGRLVGALSNEDCARMDTALRLILGLA
jgi:mRNA interferase MazF